MGITRAAEITTHAAKGALFENLIVSELLKERFNAGEADNLFYWRDKTGNEVDIVTDKAGKLTAIELKAGETIATDFFKEMEYFASLNNVKVQKLLVYGGKQEQTRTTGTDVKPWNKIF